MIMVMVGILSMDCIFTKSTPGVSHLCILGLVVVEIEETKWSTVNICFSYAHL